MPDAPRPRPGARSTTMVAINRRSAKTHSGIWRDLAVRKRRPRSMPSSARSSASPPSTASRRRSRRGCSRSSTTSRTAGGRTGLLDALAKPCRRGRRHEHLASTGSASIVTGAPHGFGRAIAQAFAAHGAQVWACDAVDDELAETRQLCGESCATRRVDVSDRGAGAAPSSRPTAAGPVRRPGQQRRRRPRPGRPSARGDRAGGLAARSSTST